LFNEPGEIVEPLVGVHDALELASGSNARYPIDLPPPGAMNPAE
jgi:hypothetical protein